MLKNLSEKKKELLKMFKLESELLSKGWQFEVGAIHCQEGQRTLSPERKFL